MLYDLWRGTVERRGDQWAIRDLALDQTWTFRQLDQASADNDADSGSGRIEYPRGAGVEFLLGTIQ
jgi:hypothetical protein